MGGDVVNDVLPADFLDVLGGSQDGPPEGRALVGVGVDVVEDHLLDLLLHFLGRGNQRESTCVCVCMCACVRVCVRVCM